MGGVYKSRPGRASKRKSTTSTQISDFDVNASVLALIPPIGALSLYYDYGTIDLPDNWKMCDGSAITDARSPFNGQTLPDFSNRYPVGFGTEGGGDIGSAAWATPPVGNASHQIDVQHTHTGPSHAHGSGNLQFQVADANIEWFNMYNSDGSSYLLLVEHNVQSGSGTGATYINGAGGTYYTKAGSGTTGAGGTGATGQWGSTTQSIQPRSIRVRYIMRIF